MRAAQHSIGQTRRVFRRGQKPLLASNACPRCESDGASFLREIEQFNCRPSCPARRPLRKNTYFSQRQATQSEKISSVPALQAGRDTRVRIVQRAAQVLESDLDEQINVGVLARKTELPAARFAGVSPAVGLTPKETCRRTELKKFKKLLRQATALRTRLCNGVRLSEPGLRTKRRAFGMTPATYQKGERNEHSI